MSLPEFSTKYPVTVAMATLAVALLGWISLDRLDVDLLPDLRSPVITVDLRFPGKTPREMEERYAQRLEGDIGTVRHVKRVHSVSRSGQAVVIAEFEWDADMDFAVLDVQKKVARYASDPDITSLDVTQEDPQALPVMRMAVSGADWQDPDELLGSVETIIRPKLEGLSGVASVEIEGGAEKEIRVTLDSYLLQAFGVNSESVVSRIREANSDVSGGTLKDGQRSYLVKGLGRLTDLADVNNLVVGERRSESTNGGEDASTHRVPVTVSDVGTVALQYKERETIVRLDGMECVGLSVYKEAGSNTSSVVTGVLQELESLEADLAGIRFMVVENQARFVERAVSEVEEAAVIGALLAVGVLLAALRQWTATLVIGLAIPISVLATFTLMYFQGLSLNVMTLGGLALGAGMLVDNAIVVIENIYRHLESGETAAEASVKGAGEVGVAILASTLTTVSVFLPIVYLHGLAGELFKEQAWTVAFSLISSLAVAMTVVPTLTARLFRRYPRRSTAVVGARTFRRFLNASLTHKGRTMAVLTACLLAAFYMATSIHTSFIPTEDEGVLHVDLALPEGTRLESTDRVGRRVAAIAQAVAGEDAQHIYLRVGTDPNRFTAVGEPTGPNRAELTVVLGQQAGRRGVSELTAALDAALLQVPNIKVNYRLQKAALEGLIRGGVAPVQVEVSGENLVLLRELTEDLQRRMEALSTVYNVRTSFQDGQPEVDVVLRPDVTAAFGLSSQNLVRELERRLGGEEAGELSRDQRARTIRVGFEDVDLRELEHARIDGPDGAMLTLGDLADLRVIQGPREILRDGQRRVGRVSAFLTEGMVLSQAATQIRQAVGQMAIPHGYRVTITGEERERAESFGGLQFALLLSVVLVYMVMASLFESLLHPFTVMLTVPLAGIGVVCAFWGLGEAFGVMAFIGAIMLGGIAVNDAIILVDHINQLRRKTADVRKAVLQGAQDRLRPILMTSATTILALLPMAVGVGEGARLRAPMAVAVIGGLVTSTLMTLVVIPVVYELIERLRSRRTA